MKKEYLLTIIAVFVFLSMISLLISGAPVRVHLVDIAAFFLAFVVTGLLAFHFGRKNQVLVWLIGGGIGLFLWDVGSAFVIVKRELFMGWFFLYPLGLIGLVLLQVTVKYISDKIPYNKGMQRIANKFGSR